MISPPLSFLAVGPQKTGTTWLYQHMLPNKNICFPKNVKETMFFDTFYHRGLARYASYFTHCSPHQLCGEIAPSYFDDPAVPQRIYSMSPECKLIITLRSPTTRAFSLYCHHLKKGRVPPNFQAAIQKMPRILTSGHYAEHIPRWLATFGQANILFVLMDDIITTPAEVLERIYTFLALPTDTLNLTLVGDRKINPATLPKFKTLAQWSAIAAAGLRAYRLDVIVEAAKKLGLKQVYTGANGQLPSLTPAEAQYLNDYYSHHRQYVQNLLARTLPSW